MLELARPADWQALSKVWRGVQAELHLPAPAIAVNGIDGYQLWFSLAQPVSVALAHAFLESLRLRYLADIVAARVGTAIDAAAPPRHTQGDRWSAFVAADLAPVFADEPWLDTAPSDDGQADMLCRLASIKHADFQAALALLGALPLEGAADGAVALKPQPAAADTGDAGMDPRRFLLEVMNDQTVALALRIEAAKALLPAFDAQRSTSSAGGSCA